MFYTWSLGFLWHIYSYKDSFESARGALLLEKNDFIIEKKCKRVKFVSPKNGLLSKRTIIGGSEGGMVKDHPFTDFYAPFH